MDRPDALTELVGVMARLRRECAWKAEQTHRSLARYLLEESHELLDAIESGRDDELREELGDVLLQVVFHAAIAEERGAFTLDDVAADLIAKLRRRNPHVFGTGTGEPPQDAEAVNEIWEQVKAAEKAQRQTDGGLMAGVAAGLPALLRAVKAQERLERHGVSPATPEAPAGESLGEQLWELVAQARAAGLDPEQVLREEIRRRTGEADRG